MINLASKAGALRARPPDNFPPCRGIPVAADFGPAGVETLFSCWSASDSQGFQIPTIFAVVLLGERGPELGRLRRWVMTQGDGAFAADFGRRILRKLLHIRNEIHF